MDVQGTDRRSTGQRELHRWVYRTQRGAQAARESSTDGCIDHKDVLKRPMRAAQMCVQGSKRRPRGVQEVPKRLQVEPQRPPRPPS